LTTNSSEYVTYIFGSFHMPMFSSSVLYTVGPQEVYLASIKLLLMMVMIRIELCAS